MSTMETEEALMERKKPAYMDVEEYQNRLFKLKEMQKWGINPYPHEFHKSDDTKSLLEKYTDSPLGHYDDAASGATPKVSIAGRLVLFRAMGKNAFGHIQDQSGRLQVMFNKQITEVSQLNTQEISPMKFIEKKLDLGDILGIEGHLFRTQKGELTIFVKEVTLLSKSLLPLPDKHSGLADKETKYRKRWLDLISDKESLDRFVIRSKMIFLIRKFFTERSYLEVETNILQNIYGGAEAKPFITHLNSLHQDMYARIAIEIALKKLLVGGMERIFEIGKIFRNEGIDRTHNPEFTMLEAYCAYQDYNYMMDLMEELFAYLSKELFGTTEVTVLLDGKEEKINFAPPWKRMSMVEAIETYASLRPTHMTDEEMRKVLHEKTELPKAEIDTLPRGLLIAALFEELAEPHLIAPHHIIDHPIETTPLCKLHRDPELAKQGFVERFETFICGREMANSYTELNDPITQRKLLVEQRAHDEAHPVDEEFVESICQGMPPAGGIGIGIDRMAMLFTNAQSIRDIIFFPLMRKED